jgi:hypothetical protein
MKKVTLYVVCSFLTAASFAQEIPRETLQDSMIGWMKIYHFKGIKEPMKVDHRYYSAAQLSLCDSFGNWMQTSYLPKGGLGDIKKIISEKLGLYNQHTAGLPQHFGAYAETYYFLKRNSAGKLTPATNHSVTWSIIANGVPPGWIIRDFSTPTQCYFTLPSFESSYDDEEFRKTFDLSHVETLAPYINFWVRSVETGGGNNYVLLSKDNRFPFVKLTKGEYLQLLDAALPKAYETEKKKLYEAEQGNEKRMAPFLKYMDDKYEKRWQSLKKTKEKYKDRLGEPALVSAQPSMTDLEVGRDVFSNGYLTDIESTSKRMPVYKVDPVMAEQCKKDNPQWILVGWWWFPNDPLEKHLHESIIYNFNFAYVYNFFFDAAKVKGQPYRPLRSPALREAVVVTELSDAAKKNRGDKNIHFFEDFSSTGIGKKPNGWKVKLAWDGKTSTVTTLEGLDGNWATGNYQLIAQEVKKPFPQDFTLSYDIVASKDFTWGAKGITLELSKETSPGNAESYLLLRLRPGFDGRDGEATIEGKFPSPPGYLNSTKWTTAPGFSNNKKYNRIAISIKKQGERLQIFIDKNKIAEYEKAIPASLLFNALSFSETGNRGENDKYYISNIKIVKE